jgi:hypothetical protein
MDGRRDRQAQNESLFRSVNERIEELVEGAVPPREGVEAWEFVCECYDTACTERLAMTVREYEAVRADGSRFVVAPALEHVDLDIERVVDMSTRYWVVEKVGEAAERAEEDDPRA